MNAFRPDREAGRPDRVVAAGQGDTPVIFGQQRAATVQPPAQQIAVADEAGDEGRGRALIQILLPADLLHAAVAHHDQAISHRHRLALVMGHHDRGDAAVALQDADLARHFLAQRGVQVGQRFVQQQQPGMDRQRPRQRHALLLAAG